MIDLFIEGIGLHGPGLESWEASAPVLRGEAPYQDAPPSLPASPLLPAAERRRAPKIVRLALAAGTEAFCISGRSPAETATIFTSSGGDGETIHDILSTLATPPRELSPTRFHNSVHNAAAGYWSIATGATAPSTSLCAHDDSFAAGLLEAAAQATATGQPVALIAYDVPYPVPLARVRPIGAVFGVAFVLSPIEGPASIARLSLALQPYAAPSQAPALLEPLRRATPAARSLPLLAALAHGVERSVTLGYLDDMSLLLHLSPP
ncbi:MAG TPA: beta-ketoacyl synthase chain length factor [Acidocella sp.]|jgi:hypothetical protein|nr:beta-ketoacyl synthase chain length factor [Acidocella sp.]